MSKSAHGQPQHYTLYAIHTIDHVGNRISYVGKTVSSDLRRILRRHIAGKNKLTADSFRRGTYVQAPTIHTLQTVYGDAAYAYRHVLGWLRRFHDSGYVTIAYPGVEHAACHMFPLTEEIYEKILAIPLEPLLSTPYSPPPTKSTASLPVSKISTQPVQLNIRLNHDELESFKCICQTHKLTQREGLVMLLSSYNPAASAQLILEQKEIIIEQVESIRSLNEKASRLSRGANADLNLKNALAFCRAGISRYIDLSLDAAGIQGPSLKCLSWNQFDASQFDRRSYSFPENDGYTVLRLEAMCYGHGRRPAIFLWGIDVEKKSLTKLRFYPKTNYIGLSIPNSPYLQKGNLVLVGHKAATDGASDLLVALPMQKSSALWQESFTTVSKNLSLDDLIRNATKAKT